MVSGHFVGIGVGTCADPALPELPHAVPDITNLVALLTGAFTVTELPDPTRAQVEEHLGALREAAPELDVLVVVWAGHAGVHGRALRLWTADKPDVKYLPATEVASRATECGAAQVLLVIDACFAGVALEEALDAAVSIQADAGPPGRVYVGVLVSCQAEERAR